MTTSFNATRDKIGYLVEQARDTIADIQIVLLKTAGLQTDGALADYADLAALLAASNDECDFTNYTRRTLTTPTRTVDNAGDRVLLGAATPGIAVQVSYPAAGGTLDNSIGKAIFVYVPTAGAANSAILPLIATDLNATTDGNELILTLHVDGFARVRNP